MKTKMILAITVIALLVATGCQEYESFNVDKPVPPQVGSEKISFTRSGSEKSIEAGTIIDGQTLTFAEEGINTFFYLESVVGEEVVALNGNWVVNQTIGGTAYYAKNDIDQIMWNFPSEGTYTVVVSGINPATTASFSHTFNVVISDEVTPPITGNVPVKWVSTVPITGGWQVTMKFFLTPGGLGMTSAPYGHAWINECQPTLYDHLPLTFTGDSTTVVFNIMNTNNNLYYTNTSGARFKFNYLVKSQAGNGTPGANGQWATPTGDYFASNTTGSGSMFEFYINLSNGVITTPGGNVHTPGNVNFNMPGSVGDNVFRAEKIGTTMWFWSAYPTNLVNSLYKRAQYKIGVNGTWVNFTTTPTQWSTTEYFGSAIPYETVSGVGDVFIRFGEEIGGVFTINENAATSPSYNALAGGFSFR